MASFLLASSSMESRLSETSSVSALAAFASASALACACSACAARASASAAAFADSAASFSASATARRSWIVLLFSLLLNLCSDRCLLEMLLCLRLVASLACAPGTCTGEVSNTGEVSKKPYFKIHFYFFHFPFFQVSFFSSSPGSSWSPRVPSLVRWPAARTRSAGRAESGSGP